MNILWLLAQLYTRNAVPSLTEQLLDWFTNNPTTGWGIAIFGVMAMAIAAIAKSTSNLDKIIGFFVKYHPRQQEITDEQRQRLRQQLIEVELRQTVKRLEASLHYKVRLDLRRQEERQRIGKPDKPAAEESSEVLKRRYRVVKPADRLTLIQTLNALPSAQFEALVFSLKPPKGNIPGPSSSQSSRSAALLEWAESPIGLGIEKLGNVLETIIDPQSQLALGPAGTNLTTYGLLKRDDIKGRLLILGEPGSGKTNELLDLARTLLQKAQKSAEQPIPVIFELSEWSSDREETFADWLSEQLKAKYNAPLAVSQQWIQQNQLFPLLDGLDELRRMDDIENIASEEVDEKRLAKQIQCMRAINAFLDLHTSTSMVVCCRRQEYEILEAEGDFLKRLNGAIYLQELADSQIQNYLQISNRRPLWDTLQNQPKLLKLARTPLFLLMSVVAYQGQPIQNTNELLDLYIEKQLGDLNNQGAYPPRKFPSKEETHHYLSWLATKLEKQEVTEFLIERLQPSWLVRKRDQRLYRLLVGLIVGPICGLIFGLIFGLRVGLSVGLSVGLIVGLIGGLIVGLIGGLIVGLRSRLDNIQSAESFNFSWKNALQSGLIVGPIFGLIFGLSTGLFSGLNVGLSIGLFSGLIVGLSIGLIGGLIFGLRGGLTVSESDVNEKQIPNQGIKSSIKTSLVSGLIFGLIFGLVFGLIGGLTVGLIGRLSDRPIGVLGGVLLGGLGGVISGGLLGGLLGGLWAVTQHTSLRVILYTSGVAPWNYETFLQHAENHRFIQRVGGRYRFVHALLRKRFAERYQLR